jgi:hypothetical protein
MTTKRGDESQTDRFAVGFAPGRCFLDFMHLTGPEDPPWRDNARFQVWMTSQQTQVYLPFKRELATPKDSNWQKYWDSRYSKAIGWHPQIKAFENPSGQFFYLDHLFDPKQHSNLVVSRNTEMVDSYECVRIETRTGGNQIWLAPCLGFAIVKRVVYQVNEGRQFKEVYRCRKFKEATQGLWLPWEIEGSRFEIVDGVDKAARSYLLSVRELGVNDAVPDEMFEFSPQPGTITIDEKLRPVAFAPGGEDLLDLWVAVCADVFPVNSGYRFQSKQLAFLLVPSLTVLFVIAFLQLSKWAPVRSYRDSDL